MGDESRIRKGFARNVAPRPRKQQSKSRKVTRTQAAPAGKGGKSVRAAADVKRALISGGIGDIFDMQRQGPWRNRGRNAGQDVGIGRFICGVFLRDRRGETRDRIGEIDQSSLCQIICGQPPAQGDLPRYNNPTAGRCSLRKNRC